MPDYIYQQFNASGKPLSGGTIYFYQSGTLTPKTVYADAAGTTALGTSVVLSASGTAVIFLDSGAYRIWIKDSTGAPVAPWVDGIVGGGVTGVDGSNATVGFFLLYNDLRAMSVGPEMAYVTGRTVEGDGGAGWFQKLPTSSVTDDGGIYLTAAGGSIVYKRVFSGPIDPEWYGVQYAVNADQSAALIAALAGSAALNFPVYVSKRVYLTMPVTVPSGAFLEAGKDGYFNSPGAVTITFAAGSRFDARGVTFGASVQPVFVTTATDAIRYSWMGGSTDDARWIKLAASSTADYIALCDDSSLISMDLTLPKNFALDFLGGAKINITSALNLDIGTFAYSGDSHVISYADMADIGTVAIGHQAARPEWFGAVGDGSADDCIAVLACAKSGSILLTNGKTYKVATALAYTGNLNIRPMYCCDAATGNDTAGMPQLYCTTTFAITGTLSLSDVATYSSVTGGISATTMYAKNCFLNSAVVSNTYACTTGYFTECFAPTGISGELYYVNNRYDRGTIAEATTLQADSLITLYDKRLILSVSNGQTVDDTFVSTLVCDNSTGNITFALANPAAVTYRKFIVMSKAHTVTITGIFWDGTNVVSSVALGGSNPVVAEIIQSPMGWYVLPGA
jgi:hypothetical protein